MSTFVPCPGVAEISIETGNPAGDVGVNKIHVYQNVADAWTEASLVNVLNTIDSWITTGGGAGQKYIDQMPLACSVELLAARDLTTQTALVAEKTVDHPGTAAGVALPSGLTKAITLRTGRAGRSFRGRVFIPFLTRDAESAANYEVMDNTKLTNLVAMWSSLITALPAGDASWHWGVLSRFSGIDGTTKLPIPRVTGVFTPIVECGYSHDAFDYQRRRAPFHGRHG